MPSQKEMVITHLKENKTINPLQSLDMFGCFRLAAVIFELKQDGYTILTDMIEVENRWGELCRVAQYRMEY